MANLILILHAVFILIVVGAVPLIIVGGWRQWQWVHNPSLRFIHLGMIAFVALESITGIECPLTTWENRLRSGSGNEGYDSAGFIAYWLHRIMYYNFPHWVFTCLYLSYGLLVASLFYFVPVRKKLRL